MLMLSTRLLNLSRWGETREPMMARPGVPEWCGQLPVSQGLAA